MKVYYVNSLLDGCYYARCLLPLVAGGWDGDKTSLRDGPHNYNNQTKGAIDADIVVFHRPDDPKKLELAKLLRQAGKKIVFDNDDTFKDGNTKKFGKVFKKMDATLDEFIKFADLVTCSTEYLSHEYRRLNTNTVVLPNCVDPDDWDEPLRNEGSKVRIGFTGSVAYSQDYVHIKGLLSELCARDDVQVVLFSLPPKEPDTVMARRIYEKEMDYWLSLDIEWQPVVRMEDYFETLNNLRLDIMCIPRSDDYFNRCKSNIKFLESSMLEIPVVAQGFTDGNSPYQGKVDSQFMRIAFTEDDFRRELSELIGNKNLRQEMGRNAREYVLENYNIHNKIYLWEDAYKKIL